MKALVEKGHINEKTRKRDEEGSTFFLCTFIKGTQGNSRKLKETQGNSRELKGTQGNSMELKGIQGNWRELEGTHGIWIYSREALVEVMKGKNSGKGAKRENFTNQRRRRRRKEKT